MSEVESKNHEYYIIRTSSGKEDKFLEALEKVLSKKENTGIYALFRPETVKGYIFAEALSLNAVVDGVRGIPNNKGVIRTPISFEELSKYFDKEGEVVNVHERDIVEIISGPFKGDRAKVVRLVPGKDEIIIEPINMAVPIPITLSPDDIRVVEEADKEE